MANIQYNYGSRSSSRKTPDGGVARFVGILIIIALIIGVVVVFINSGNSSETKKPEIITVSVDPQSKAKEICHNALTEMANAISVTDYVKAKEIALAALDNPEIKRASAEYRAIGAKLSEVNMHILNGGLPCKSLAMHTVKPGDSLSKIAGIYNMPVPTLQKANRIAGANIHAGQVIKVYQAKFSIEVSKGEHLLYVFDNGKLFRLYDVGIGKENRTPAGEFLMVDKISEPDWDGPNGRIPYQAEGNILGTRWLKLEPVNDKGLTGYGIHGTWEEGSITQDMSNGCVRMRNAEVEELFDYIPRRTPVKIFE